MSLSFMPALKSRLNPNTKEAPMLQQWMHALGLRRRVTAPRPKITLPVEEVRIFPPAYDGPWEEVTLPCGRKVIRAVSSQD